MDQNDFQPYEYGNSAWQEEDRTQSVIRVPEQAHPAGQSNAKRFSKKKIAALLAAGIAAVLGVAAIVYFGVMFRGSVPATVADAESAIADTSGKRETSRKKDSDSDADDDATAKEEANSDRVLALIEEGDRYYWGDGNLLNHDFPSAFDCYYEAAEAGNTEAMRKVARAYRQGFGVEADLNKAFNWLNRATDAGDTYAYVLIGELYEFYGFDATSEDEYDYKAAMRWYEKAADAGEGEGLYAIGRLYETGRGVEKDQKEAFSWCEKAAALDNTSAMFSLAYYYENGLEGVAAQDYEKAFEWYQAAADCGDARGLSCMAFYYLKGIYVEKDTELFFFLADQAAEQEDSWALYTLGYDYLYGDEESGIEPDFELGVYYADKGANLGYVDCMYLMGNIFSTDLGQTVDYELAYRWYTLGAFLGDDGCVEAMISMVANDLVDASGNLTQQGAGTQGEYGAGTGQSTKEAGLYIVIREGIASVSVRSAPTSTSEAIATAKAGDEFAYVDHSASEDGTVWNEVLLESGETGYIRDDFCELTIFGG